MCTQFDSAARECIRNISTSLADGMCICMHICMCMCMYICTHASTRVHKCGTYIHYLGMCVRTYVCTVSMKFLSTKFLQILKASKIYNFGML